MALKLVLSDFCYSKLYTELNYCSHVTCVMSEAKLYKYIARLHVNVKRITKQSHSCSTTGKWYSTVFELQSTDLYEADIKIKYITKAGAGAQSEDIINSVFERFSAINKKRTD